VHATVADAVRLGADAVGYTLYVGTPAAEADYAQYRRVREDAARCGMPLIVWAYPRGSAIDAVVRSANRTLMLVSGGEQQGDEAMLEKARRSMEAGATGLIFGRNVWQRGHDESLAFTARLQEILAKYPRAARQAVG
jgi:class I fructose-bisphosphate aldolase